ncbi:GAF domain-containing protein [Paenibacillus sp. YYML68]|uniref:GAF domain-containing protein n=1 Tax=Paenibacillus sp. YYML68 TaxID=2909250 RepID=UPI002490D83C|nr:GAF domain-containing protein [Paenibacillus sp. YYML68]
MMLSGDELRAELHMLRMEQTFDFAGVARIDRQLSGGHWVSVTGNRTDKYKHMVLKQGRGVAGTALMTGRLMTHQAYVQTGMTIADCPMMLAEGLLSAVAIPIRSSSGVLGVLFIGSRQSHAYSLGTLVLLERVAGTLRGRLQEEWLENELPSKSEDTMKVQES